jgi:hypothetical protein
MLSVTTKKKKKKGRRRRRRRRKKEKFISNNDRCKLQEIVHLVVVIGHQELSIFSTKKSVLAT